MDDTSDHDAQATVWNYYKPRHTHTWNMLVISWRSLDAQADEDAGFETEYMWENFIIRLWLYRNTVRALLQLDAVKAEAKDVIANFDQKFAIDGKNGLKALRDMIEHFDEYAAGKGHGPATREGELDPWREVTRDRFERGRYVIERKSAYDAAIILRSDAKRISDAFITWYKSVQ